MGKFNNVRFINLNYNNNTMKIEDQIFYLNGENTMLNLRNGGGKSVLVQMMMAPFVSKRYRDLGERPFESYFTSKTPTYILVEWNLEDGAGYLLTGMMVRKKDSSSDEDSKDNLDITCFIHEYRNKNEYDIKNIPFIEEQNGRRKIKSFMNSKNLFEDIKRDNKYNFNYYDMSNSTTSRAYYNKLKEYGIDNKEWNNIIRKINLKESGLSELFKEAKNSEGLIKSWFLPTIENKLNKDEDRIKKYKEIITSYVIQYKTNKSNIDRKNKIELFNEKSEEMLNLADICKNNLLIEEANKNKIANTQKYLVNELDIKNSQIDEIEKQKEVLKDKKSELIYEELSMEIYNNLDKSKVLDNEISIKTEEKEDIENKKKKCIREKNILKCAEVYKRYKNLSLKLQRLENEINVLNQEECDNKPRINDLGFSILSLLQKEKNILEEELMELKNRINSLDKENKDLDDEIRKNRTTQNQLNKQVGAITSNVEGYDKLENKFNKDYNESFIRNITGYYNEEDILVLKKKIENEIIRIDTTRATQEKNIQVLTEEEKSKTSIKESKGKEIILLDTDNKHKAYKLKEYDEELSKRRDILKYLGEDEDYIFKSEFIANALDRKILRLENDRSDLTKKLEKNSKYLNMLKTGEVLELPKELEVEFKKLDIKIVYGMKWLKDQGYSTEQKETIVRNNPFIPYCIILDKKTIKILKEEKLEAFTSSPIVIIEREKLEEAILTVDSNILEFEGVNFYISFNNKLLNEESLKNLIDQYEEKINLLNKNIAEKVDVIKHYRERKVFIDKSKLTEEVYNNLKSDIEQNHKTIELLKKDIIDLTNKLGEIQHKLKLSNKIIDECKREKEHQNNKKSEYNQLCIEYIDYKNNKQKLDEVNELLKITVEVIKKYDSTIEANKEELKLKEDINRNNNEKLKNIQDKISEYAIYNEGNIIKKDYEDLVSEYKALTETISSSLKELMEEKGKADSDFKEVEIELSDNISNYNLVDSDYINANYDYKKVHEIEKEEAKYNEEIKLISASIQGLELEKKGLERDIKNIKQNMIKEGNPDTPKERTLIFNKDFKKELAELTVKEKGLLDEEKSEVQVLNDLKTYISSLAEFDFEIKEIIELDIEKGELNAYILKLKKDVRNNKEAVRESKDRLEKLVDKLSRDEVFIDDSLFKDAFKGLIRFVDSPTKFIAQLNTVLDAYNRIVDKLKADIQLIISERDKIVENILEYIERINENIGQLDNNSSIEIRGKRVKMLNVNQANWEENSEVYKIKVKGFIETLRDQCIELLEKNESINQLIDNRVTVIKLFDEVVGISSININLYKIEEDKQKQISWDEVSKNSGGEGFLSAFVILSSLLSYMRKEDRDIFKRKEEGKVLIMDNPFAQTNSAHLLKPLMDISKKSNTQLICLTGLGGDSIYSRFDNIYVLNLVSSKLKTGLKIVNANHLTGEEEKSVIVASRTKIEDIQTMLF